LPFLIAEILCNGQARKGNAGAGSRRFVHLAINQRGFFNDLRLLHFKPKVIAFTGTLADASEHRVAAVLGGDVVDQFHDDDGLADTGPTEEPDFSTLLVGSQQVDNLDAGFENLLLGVLLGISRRRTVDGIFLFGLHGTHLINRFAQHVQDATQNLGANRNGNESAGIHGLHAALQSIGGTHGNGTHDLVTQVERHFKGQIQTLRLILDLQGVVDGG
jgi:hypothetical protein